MLKIFKNIVTTMLIWEAKWSLERNHPTIIGVTGSVGKSSTKEAVASVLDRFGVRKSAKSYNSELGLALAVLGLKTRWHNPIGWIKNLYSGFVEIFNQNFPKILVLEMGVDRPKDLDRLLKIAKPDIGIVTAIGQIPVHVEFFSGPEELAKEKSKILKGLASSGWAILNFDDETVWSMKERTSARVLSFGFGSGADITASNYKISQEGISFKTDYKGATVPVKLKGVFGKHHVYAALAAMAVGITFDMNLIDISEALNFYTSPPGRLKLLEGVKNSWILDDSYNSSPLAVHAALDTLAEFGTGRKIAVLGDMLELGKFTISAHQAAGAKVAKTADYFVTIGPRSKFSADEAIAQGMSKSKVESFSTSQEAAERLKALIQQGDVVLVKGSQSMRTERVVEELMAYPQEAGKLLVRQDAYWQKKLF